MKTDLTRAIEKWETAWQGTLTAAEQALSTALPGLTRVRMPTCTCEARFVFATGGGASGRVCIDNEGRVTFELDGLPNPVLAEAADHSFGSLWLDPAEGPLTDQPPGTYALEDELASTDFTVVLGDDGTGRFEAVYAMLPAAATLLGEITAALHRHQQRTT